MVRIKVRKTGIEMTGHAGYVMNGQDIVCAAISALTCSLINSLKSLAEEDFESEVCAGNTVIRWQKLSDKGKLLVDSWYLAMLDINTEYHCVQIV